MSFPSQGLAQLLMGQPWAGRQPKMLCCGIALAFIGWVLLKLGAFAFIPGNSQTWVVTLLAVFGSIIYGRLSYRKKASASE